MIKVDDWNLADAIETKEDVIGILEAVLEENDTVLLFKVIDDIARSKGMLQIANELNLPHENLCRSFSPDNNLLFTTVANVLEAIGFKLCIHKKSNIEKNTSLTPKISTLVTPTITH
jgi:probable addiction module antidote protein